MTLTAGRPSGRGGARTAARRRAQAGHTLLIVLLVATVMIIGTTVAAKVWSTVMQREREDELIFRGRQYAQAIVLYKKMRGMPPTDLKQLLEKGPKGETFLRQEYKDPITGQDFGLVFLGPNNVPIPDEPIEPNGLDDDDDTAAGGFGAPAIPIADNSNRGANPSPNRNTSGFNNASAFGAPSGTVGGGMPILGVHSKSKALAIGPAKYHDLEHYNQWLFLSTDLTAGGQPVVPVGGQQGGGIRGANPSGLNSGGGFGAGAQDTSGSTGPPGANPGGFGQSGGKDERNPPR